MKNRGQNVIEFAIVVALVSIASIFALILLGDNVKSLFQNSKTKYDGYKAFDYKRSDVNTTSSVNTVQNTTNLSVVNTYNISGYDVEEYDDGSIGFMVNDQQIILPENAVKLQETVTEAIGSNGWGDLVKEVAYMIEKYKDEYPDSDVPVEIFYGTGDRVHTNDDSASYSGNAIANSTTIKVGNHVIILQKDQQTGGSSSFKGLYRAEGDMVNNKFIADVTGIDEDGKQAFAGDLTATNFDLNGVSTAFLDNFTNNGWSSGYTYDWTFDFSNPEHKFNL